MAENTDLAVLGFSVKTAGADAAFKKILDSLGTVESKFKETDKLLEDTVTKSMKQLGSVVRGVNSAANALNRNKGLFDAFDSLKTFATEAQNLKVDAKAIKEALEIMSNSRLTSMAKRLGDAFSTFERGTKVLEFEMKLANPDFLEQLKKDLLITIEPTTKAALSELKSSMDSLAKGVVTKLIPSPDSLKELKEAVQDGIKPEIKFDDNAKGIVANLYSVIRDGIKQQGPILVPLQFAFGRPKSDRPGTNLSDPEKQARDDVRATLEEYAKDFGGMGGLNAVWDKAILGGPEAIEKIRRVLATRTGWLEEAVGKSLDKAKLTPSKYGELVEQGLESIPVDVANTVDKLASQLKGLLKRHQEEFTFRPEIGTATQSEEDIKGVLADLASRVQKVSKKEFNSLPIPIGSVTLRPNNVLVSPVDAKTVFFATESIDADIKKVVAYPKNLKIDASAVPEGKAKLVADETLKVATTSPLDVEVAKLNVRPRQVAINLNDVAKEAFKITAGRVALTPESIKINLPQAIQNMSILRLDKPLGVSAEIVVKPIGITVTDGYEGTVREPISVTSKIKLDPLPSDEIDKLDKLVTRLHDVETAYSNIQVVAARLRDTVKDLDAAMSAEVKALIKADSKGALKMAQESKRQQARDARAKTVMDDLLNAYTNGKSDSANRLQTAQDEMDRLEKLDRATGMYARNQDAFNDELDKAKDKFTKLKPSIDAYAESLSKTATENAQQLRGEVKKFVQDTLQMSQSLARATSDAAKYGKNLREASLEMRDFNRVAKVNMIDPLARMKAELGETNSRMVDLMRTFGIYMSGRTVVGFFRQAAESANNFQLEIRRIQSLAMDFDFGELRNGLMDIDARFGSVAHNAQALYWAYSSGVRGTERDLTNFVEIMSKTATTIKSDIMPTVDAATSIMNAWNLSAQSASEIGDLLFGIIKYGKANAQQLTTSLGHVVAPAAALNIELNELGAAAATLTKTMKTNRAFTYLSNILGKMASPTKAVQEAAAELGIELSADAIKAKGFANVMREIRDVTNGDIAKIAKLFPDLRGQRAAITLLSTQFRDFENQLINMENKTGSMTEALEKISSTPEAQIKALRNSMSMLAIEAGNATNNMLTLGGALGPVLEWFNGLDHAGRAVAGNLAAAAAATAGIMMASKAFLAAQYAAAQTSFQLAMSTAEIRRNELDISLTMEKQALENNKIAMAEMKARIVAAENNDDQLRSMRAQEDSLKSIVKKRRDELNIMRQSVKLSNVAMAPSLTDAAAQIGQSEGRIRGLENVLNTLASDDQAQKMKRTVNLIGRMNADLARSRSAIEFRNEKTTQLITKQFNSLVEQSQEIQQNMQNALAAGDRGNYETYKEELSSIIGIIKNDEIIASAMKKGDVSDDYLEMLVQGKILADLKMEAVSGEVFEHNILTTLVKQELKEERDRLAEKRRILEDTVRQSKASEEDLRQLQEIAQKESDIAAFEHDILNVRSAIDDRTGMLVGRQKEQYAILAENVKAMKAWLDADTTDSANLKANLEASLKTAATLGKDTLSATQAAYDAEMKHQSIIMQQRSVLTEIMGITDANGKLLDNSEKTQERFNELTKKQVQLLMEAEASRKRFIELGLKAGNADARERAMSVFRDYLGTKTKGRGSNAAARGLLVDQMARDSKVVSESLRSMAKSVGQGVFGNAFGGNSMRLASMGMSFIPGMGKYALPASMMMSFNAVGKVASGFTRLTGTMLNLTSTTERLQKNGLLGMKANVEILTKSLMTSSMWTKKAALENDAFMAMRGAGVTKNAMASFGVASTWLGAISGTVLISAIATAIGVALSKTESGGPMRGLADKIYGVDRKEGYLNRLDARQMAYSEERADWETTSLELQRLVKAQNAELKSSRERLKNMKELKQSTDLIFDMEQEILEGEVNLARQRDALAKLASEKNVQRLSSQIYTSQDKINELSQRRSSWLSFFGGDIDRGMLDNMIQLETKRRDELIAQRDAEYQRLFEGLAETRYQSLMAILESDRNSAFAPKKDEQGKLDLAIKMADMARNRIASLISSNGKLIDITQMTTLEVNEMIRSRVKMLTLAYEQAQKTEKEAKDMTDLESLTGDERKKAEEKLNKLAANTQKSKTELDNFMQNVPAAFRDFYSNTIGSADAFVEKVLHDVKERTKNTKFDDLFRNYSLSFQSQTQNIIQIQDALYTIQEDYVNGTGVFRGLKGNQKVDQFKTETKKLNDAWKEQVSGRAQAIQNLAGQMDSFMTGLASDMESQAKSIFDYKMNNPLFANARGRLIRGRMGLLNQLLFGEGGAIAMRNNALQEARRLQGIGDLAGAQKQLQEAQKWQKKTVDLEHDRLDLVKLEADKQKEIGADLYKLADTLRGRFSATTQQAVSADSIEAIRLRSRSFEQNVAPPKNDYQVRLAKMYVDAASQSEKLARELERAATSLVRAIEQAAGDKRIDSAAVDIKQAGDSINAAAGTFQKAANSTKTMIRIKRL